MKISTLFAVLATVGSMPSSAGADGHANVFNGKSGKSSKSAKSAKSAKTSKATKIFKGKDEGVQTSYGDGQSSPGDASAPAPLKSTPRAGGCVLPALTRDMRGKPKWIQNGQVMTFYVENGSDPSSPPRKVYTDDSPEIAEGDTYVLECAEKGYVPDEMCHYTCKDGFIDSSTYCRQDPTTLCVLMEDATAAKQCNLDFDSDEPFNEGKSLKQWWAEVLDKFVFGKDELFKFDNNTLPSYLGHGAANLAGAGWVLQHMLHVRPDPDAPFDADIVTFSGWVDDNYEYGPDTLRGSSSSATVNGFVQDVIVEDYQDERFPDVSMRLPKVVAPIEGFNPRLYEVFVLGAYDPCTERGPYGFLHECYVYHHAGFHLGSGEQLHVYPPMSNGNIDLMGHCSTAETNDYIMADMLRANMDNVDDVIKKAGGITNVHAAVMSLHLCVGDDIYHPFICSVGHSLVGKTPNSVGVSATPFMFQPKANRAKVCADKKANPDLCTPIMDPEWPKKWTNTGL